MPFLLDTCAVSEFLVKTPERKVVHVLRTLPRPETFLPSLVLGQIKQGIERLPSSKRRTDLEQWLYNQLIPSYADRIIPFNTEEALRWGELQARMRKEGTTLELEDSLIAATALTHGLTVVTRNEDDFVPAGVRVLNPWK